MMQTLEMVSTHRTSQNSLILHFYNARNFTFLKKGGNIYNSETHDDSIITLWYLQTKHNYTLKI